mmetsp:Transcript_24723/g.56874  ORF Transcript_24723/g.56874 Transcript_24723/m.56874 type:complete len:83 (-) Transcript_24723:298-546(-)
MQYPWFQKMKAGSLLACQELTLSIATVCPHILSLAETTSRCSSAAIENVVTEIKHVGVIVEIKQVGPFFCFLVLHLGETTEQ